MNNNYIHSTEVEEDIAKRLEKLNKWQEEQKKLLQERQNMQMQMLGMEQRKMYEMLGIHAGGEDSNMSLQSAGNKIGESISKDNPLIIKNDDKIQKDGISIDGQDLQQVAFTQPKSKKSFLRRGEGLKQRFKIDPNALRLNNLPRYKYANVHARFLKSNQRRSVPKPLKTMGKQDELCEELNDINERRFQQLLISANNFCNSTPDSKLVISASKSSIVELDKERILNLAENTEEAKHVQYDTDSSLNSKHCEQTGVSWANVLDAQQIKPISMQQLRPALNQSSGLVDHDENLSIFELLEQKANEGSIDMNSSCIRQFLHRKSRSDDDDQDRIPVQSCLKSSGLLPNVTAMKSLSLNVSEEEEDLTGTEHKSDFSDTLTPEKQNERRPCVQVRFSDTNDTRAYTEESETSTVLPDESSSAEIFKQFKQALLTVLQFEGDISQNDTVASVNSTFSNHFTALQSATHGSLLQSENLLDIVNLIKIRLAELEKEIAQFKDNNINLIKAKQNHELEKVHFAQEREEGFEKLNDEKIQMEIYLHDERMKLEDEKRKFERQMQMQKSSATSQSRKETAKLKQEVEDLQMQLKHREQAHISAQARLRAQIRNLEKDQKQLYEDNERLMKENKRLQNENIQIGRENNNKMLQEINRNIAKLAPKLTHVSYVDEDVARRTKVSKNSISSASKISEIREQRGSHKKSKRFEAKSNCSNEIKRRLSGTNIDSKSSSEGDGFLSDSPKDDTEDLRDIGESINNKQTQSLITTLSANTNELKREIINSDGSKDVLYCNGNLKKISADGMSIRMLYFNKDIKETNINEGTVKYYYSETNTWHTTYLDGLEILEFPNGQTEHRYQNGVVEVHFPNNSIKVTDPADENKLEEWRFEDGTHLVEMRNGDKILTLPNGQKEIHTKLNKRREYPDGTVKFVYPDGSQETRYSNGRVRLKDKDGNLVMDTENVT